MHRIGLSILLALVASIGFAPKRTHAAGAWTTYLRTVTCNDLIATSDTVWMATGEAGIVRYLRAEDRFESIVREPGGLASNLITTFTFDRSGQLWAGTPGKGVSRLSADGADWSLVNAFDGLPSDSVTTMFADGDTVWIGTTRGIALWDGRQIAGTVPDLGTPSPFANNLVTGIVVYGDTLFVGTPTGVYLARLSQQLATWTLANTGLVTPNIVAVVTDGVEVFALANGACHRWNRIAGTWGVAGGNGSSRRLRADAGRILSISTLGVFRWVTNAWQAISGSPLSGPSGDGGVEITTDADGVVFAVQAGQLLEQASPTWIARRPPAPVGNDIVNVVVEGANVYVNSPNFGFSRLRDGVWRSWEITTPWFGVDTTFRFVGYPYSLQVDGLGRKWIGSWDASMARLDDSGPIPSVANFFIPLAARDSLAKHTYGWASCMDNSGYLYFGLDTPDRGGVEPAGIDVYTPNGDWLINYRTSSTSILDNQVRALAVDENDYLWAGFPSKGVAYANLDSTGQQRLTLPRFTPVAGFENLDIFGIVAYGDSIWVLTTSSLRRIRASTRNPASQLDIPAGPAPRGAVHPLDVAADGTVWVGSVDGVRMYRRGGGFEDFRVDNSPLADNEVRTVRVDRATGAVWIATAAGLHRYDPAYTPPPAPVLQRLNVTLYPNPVSLSGAGFQLRLRGDATAYEGEVIDLRGTRVRRFVADGNNRIVWNGRDDDGRLVPAGIYFLRARGDGAEATKRVVVLR